MYKGLIDARVGMTKLTKLIEKAGKRSELNDAYAFAVKNKSLVKILTRDEISTNLLELDDIDATQFKELVLELSLCRSFFSEGHEPFRRPCFAK